MSNRPVISGSINTTMDAITTVPAGPPHTYLGVARGLMHGVRVLASKDDPSVSLALAMLSAQVAECTLKAALSLRGDDRRLKDAAIRHDLVKLWQLAVQDGITLASQPPDWFINLAALHAKPYYLRYSTGVHGVVLPATEPMATDLEQLLATVEEHF